MLPTKMEKGFTQERQVCFGSRIRLSGPDGDKDKEPKSLKGGSREQLSWQSKFQNPGARVFVNDIL